MRVLLLTVSAGFALLATLAPSAFADDIGVDGGGLLGGHPKVNVRVSKPAAKSNLGSDKSAAKSEGSSEPVSDPCRYIPIRPVANDPRLGGDDPATGVLSIISCPDLLHGGTGNVVYATQGTVWARNGVPAVARPPDPAQVAQEAVGQMIAPNPVITLGPHPNQLAVKIPVWLSVNDPGPMTLTVAVRGLSVTVTATLTSTTWSMGEPVDPANPSNKVAAFTCPGSGTPAPAVPDSRTPPPCGYTYIWKSTADRTHGTRTWPVTATTNWHVTWTASNGAAGVLPNPLTPNATVQVNIGEWRSTLINGSG